VGPAVLNSVSLQLPSVLLSLQFGATPVGLYAIGQRILGMPLGLVSAAVSQVFLGDAAMAAHAGPQALRPRFAKSVRLLAIIGSLVVIPIAAIAPYGFGFLFGSEWHIAGQYLQVLSPMLIASFVASPMGVILDVLERQDLHLFREISRITLLLLAWWVSRTWGAGPMMMVASLSVAGACGYIVGLGFVWKAIRESDNRPRDQEQDM
jgi:O-antigen/teichoic acid export membrane protein